MTTGTIGHTAPPGFGPVPDPLAGGVVNPPMFDKPPPELCLHTNSVKGWEPIGSGTGMSDRVSRCVDCDHIIVRLT